MSKGPCKCLFGHDTAKKGEKQKESIKKPNQEKRRFSRTTMCQKERKSQSGKGHRPPCLNRTRGTNCHDREGDCWHLHPHCKHVRKINCQIGKDCPLRHSQKKNRPSQHQSLDGGKFREKFTYLNVIQTGSKNGRSPNAPPYDQQSTE